MVELALSADIIYVTCPGCRRRFRLPLGSNGKSAVCKCGERFRIIGAESPGCPQKKIADSEATDSARTLCRKAPNRVFQLEPLLQSQSLMPITPIRHKLCLRACIG